MSFGELGVKLNKHEAHCAAAGERAEEQALCFCAEGGSVEVDLVFGEEVVYFLLELG